MSEKPFLSKGDQGKQVERLQEQLRRNGLDPGVPDGIFGSITEDAVKKFQQRRGLAPDGVVGVDTRQHLELEPEVFVETQETEQDNPELRLKTKKAHVEFDATTEDGAEPADATGYRPVAILRPDDAGGPDLLDFTRDVQGLADVIAAREVRPPLSIGLFGNWGVGKSFFMQKLREEIAARASVGELWEENRGTEGYEKEPGYWSSIVSIDFNAWHYMDDNLWASLVVRLFDGLFQYLEPRAGTVDLEREGLLAELELASREAEQLREQEIRLDEAISTQEQDLASLREQAAAAEATLAGLSPGELISFAWRRFLGSDGGKQLTAELRETGFTGIPDDVDQVKRHMAGLQTGLGRTQALAGQLLSGPHRKRRALMLGIFLVLGPVVTWGATRLLGALTGSAAWAELLAMLTGAVAMLGPIAGRLQAWLKVAREKLQQVEDSFREYGNLEAQQLAEGAQEVAAAEERLTNLEIRHDEVRTALNENRVKRVQIREQLADLRVGRRMLRFVTERAESREYRDQLGIIATIRKDLNTLSDFLTEASQEKRRSWQETTTAGARPPADPDAASPETASPLRDIDRIVLYIDDLDRCSPERVVEVLQAVHLLLSFPLFVVVVAVDSRWLELSLKDVYKALPRLDSEVGTGSAETVTRWTTTPRNYLEKIFQIVLNIQPMNQDGFTKLVKSLTGYTTGEGGKQPAERAGAEESAAAATPEPVVTRTSGPPAGDDRAMSAEAVADMARREALAALTATGRSAHPEQLALHPWESEFMATLHALIDTPRGLHRMVNTYRLIRATQESDELQAFTAKEAPGYRVVAALLAIQSGRPLLAQSLFRGIGARADDEPWAVFLTSLAPARRSENDGTHHNAVCDRISAADLPRWQQLTGALNAITTLASIPLGDFKAWLPRVEQYSIHPARRRGAGEG